MNIKRANEIEKYLSSNFVSFKEGAELREELRLIYQNYKPKQSENFYFNFLKDNCAGMTIELNGEQNKNFPQVYTIFTIKTQHIRGNCIEHCIDKYLESVYG